jgi:hypothetical protein
VDAERGRNRSGAKGTGDQPVPTRKGRANPGEHPGNGPPGPAGEVAAGIAPVNQTAKSIGTPQSAGKGAGPIGEVREPRQGTGTLSRSGGTPGSRKTISSANPGEGAGNSREGNARFRTCHATRSRGQGGDGKRDNRGAPDGKPFLLRGKILGKLG